MNLNTEHRRMEDKSVTAFLLSPHYRTCRHLLLQIIVLLMTINVFWYEPLQSVSFWRRFGGFLAYFVSINTVIYMNLYILVPCFLLKNRLGHYVLAAVLTNLVVIVFLSVTQAAISLFTHWLRYNLRIDELESTTLQSELTFLKNQINPHFLFNMLNNANVLIKRNPEEASKVLFKLEDLLRYQINDSSRERVSLASDIRFLNDYLNLEKIRRDNFQFTLRQEGEVDSIWIQPLLFIPFVENAVKHSFDSEHSSYVHVFFKVDAHRLDFRCENSKPAVAVQQGKVGGIGLANIQRRLGLLYPEHYKLEQREDENLYSVILSITL